MSPISDALPTADDEDRRWAEASRRVQELKDHGPRVRGISNQLALVILIVLLGGLAVVARLGEPLSIAAVCQFVLLAAALVVSGVGYARARRGGRLLSQIPTPRAEWPLSPLLPEERRSLARQLRGRIPPTKRSREIVPDLIANSRLNNRAVLPSLVGFVLFLFSESLYLGWPWPLIIAGMVVFLVIMTRVEARRWQKALELNRSTFHA
ncbi:hypothetical protein GCM10025867_08780 [Frondihabitans sucicola]|uniref:DUF3040 domain-containing protein n=1 Tax=Frondihabitans sucicola TaxID=1268041 RepID=A0ABM8GJS5_9MICO|nr:hypothetical protein [Frondihabitans sucicola]BDZ48637.1 hypothetical protein GCM10025867_08780 [Frondihabitans sucicola]